MNILIIGTGSAGMRFLRILRTLKQNVSVYAHRNDLTIPRGTTAARDLNALPHIDGAIIASPPNTHLDYATLLITKRIPLLIEKPLAYTAGQARAILNSATERNVFIMPGFNLRFLPIIDIVGQHIEQLGKLYFAEMTAGYYLPLFRKRRNLVDTYSAHFAQGGGVALDLIHEIDLALQWFGPFSPNTITSRKLSNLDIDCEDFVQILVDSPFHISITLDYLSHVKRRTYLIVGEKGTIMCDIPNKHSYIIDIHGNTKAIQEKKMFDIQQSYRAEMRFFLECIADNRKISLTKRQLGIDALEIAEKSRKYVRG